MNEDFQRRSSDDEPKIQMAPALGSLNVKGLVCGSEKQHEDALGNRKGDVIVHIRNPLSQNGDSVVGCGPTGKAEEHQTEKSEVGNGFENSNLCALPIRLPLVSKTNVDKVIERNDGPCCRICFRSSSEGALLSPCACKGTMGSVHRNCLETWLTSRGIEACELCGFQFVTCRTPQNFWDWWRNPENNVDRRNVLGDLLCFILLTPIGLTSLWLCIQGANHYRRYYGSTWETAALAALSIFLIMGYALWIFISVRYHCAVFRRWRDRHHNIHLIIDDNQEVTDNGDRNEAVMNGENSAPDSSESICLEGADDMWNESGSSNHRLIHTFGRCQKQNRGLAH